MAKPHSELAREVLHEGMILGRGACGYAVSSREERIRAGHDHCLHLWRPVGQERPTPPQELVR